MDMHRREFLLSLGAIGVISVVPSAAHAAFACAASKDTGCRIIDASKNLAPAAKHIADAGATTTIRFYTRLANLNHGPYQNTALSKEELKALEDQGLAVATVFQYFSGGHGHTFQEPTKKIYDVRDALKYADMMKQPEGSTIYFGADFDMKVGDLQKNISAVKRYFEHAQNEVSKSRRKIGLYGCGKACEVLAEEKWDMNYWISASVSYLRTAEFFNGGNWHLFQTRTEVARRYGKIDTNILNPKFTSFGQWRSNGSPVNEPSAASQKILDAHLFPHQRIRLFSDPSRPKQTLIGSAPRGRPVRVICREGDAVGLSLNESDNLWGYCRSSDLNPTIPSFPR
ncbi:glycoside hydrolase domain-containing protein [Mesorhizobium sp. M0323]|uniref:glycoside hydrolase domain-containing protein n=1 Tax=Mesorhizobium sp. M0323 TaxID=2956938 RepID=UPI00333A8B3E